jgi:hypothetical protein
VAAPGKVNLAKQLLRTLVKDRDEILLRIDDYVHGRQDDPYMPDNADDEYKLLAARSITNVMDFIVSASAQAMYVDQFRKGSLADATTGGNPRPATTSRELPEWSHWQKSRLDARQAAIYRGALIFGHSFVLTEMDAKKKTVRSKGLSALNTSALYEDAANDDAPYIALTVTVWPKPATGEENAIDGKARMWDGKHEYAVTFESTKDLTKGISSKRLKPHGATECPITRFTAAVDLEGRTCGVVAPMIPLQDRINQTVFDMLIVQSFASFKVRTISGMAPPVKMRPLDAEGHEVEDPDRNADDIVEWVPRLDSTGNPIPEPINLNARRVFWAEDQDTKFGTLDETPLDGFIEAIKLAFQHMAALSQTPPHHLLGQIANLSAEALIAAETALSRKVEEFKSSFGESWERVFRIAAEIGSYEGAEDFAGEVIWRDLDNRSLAQSADALGKLAESLGIPKRALWNRVPGVTSNELQTWEELEQDDNVDRALAGSARVASVTAATTSLRPTFRAPSSTGPLDATKDAVLA